jgi:ATP-dependent Lon protease
MTSSYRFKINELYNSHEPPAKKVCRDEDDQDDGLDRMLSEMERLHMPVAHMAHCRDLISAYRGDNENFSTSLTAAEWILSIYRKSAGVSRADQGFRTHSDLVDYINTVKDTMERSTYGHQETKQRIIEFLVGKAVGISQQQVIGLCGPSGIGKTTLATKGFAKALGLPFYQISLGGLKDSSLLSGTARYWKGAHPGVFAKILAECGSECVVYIDEIDKISMENATDIYGYLTHAFDPLTNNSIQDNYLGIGLDLSKVLFVISFNDVDVLPMPLLDRINLITLQDFSIDQKASILEDYLLGEVLDSFLIPRDQVLFAPGMALHIAKKFEASEGLRCHKRLLHSIISSLLVMLVLDKRTYSCLIRSCPGLKGVDQMPKLAGKGLPYTIDISDIED